MSDNRRTRPLKWYLYLLIAGSILPLTFFASVLVSRSAIAEREQARTRLERAAQALSWTIEREISGSVRTLEALAESEFLDNNRLEAFYHLTRRVTQSQPTWRAVILLSPDGRILFDTEHPFSERLGRVNEPSSLQKVLSTQQPVVGSLARGPQGADGYLAFPVRVPVKRNGQLLYILTAVVPPAALREVMAAQVLTPDEWTRTVVDDKGIVVARTREPERYIGKKGTPYYLQRIAEQPEGFFRNYALDGRDVYVAYSRIPESAWTASISVSTEVLDAPGTHALATVLALGAGMLVLSGVGALILSRRIARAMSSSAAGAVALARGEEPRVEDYGIEEIASLSDALHGTSALLKASARERDEHLAQAETARDEAEESSRLKDVFLATVSHELRSPLTAILGWASLLGTNQLDESMRHSSIQTIERCARSLAALVQDLLDTSRIISGKMVIEGASIDLTDAVVAAIESVRPTANVKHVTLAADVPRSFCITGDQQRLEQVVSNLLSNAVKFTPEGGSVEVALKEVDSQVELRVRDTGIGIDAEFLPHVFERFRQADGSTTREYGGLGLGLAIARQLVEMHGGTIRAESDGPGQGSTFIVRLPLLDSARVPSQPAPSTALDSANASQFPAGPVDAALTLNANHPEYSLQGIRVLVVDDEADVRELIASALRLRGADVQECETAIEAFDKYVEWKPKVILSDIAMPQQDGFDFIRRIRHWEAPLGITVPAVALTALAGDEDRERSLEAGFQAHLPKPVETEELCRTVLHVVGKTATEGAHD